MSTQRDVVREAVIALCAQVDTPRSLTIATLLEAGEDLELTRVSIDPRNYVESQALKFRDDYLVTELLSKYKGLNTGIDTKQAALRSFKEGEEKCRLTNSRLVSNAPEWCAWDRAIKRAQNIIRETIGEKPSWLGLQNRFRWSNGATATLSRRCASIDKKVREDRISVTYQAMPYLRAAMATDYTWLRSRGIEAAGPVSVLHKEFHFVEGNCIDLVDKNAKTGRTIAMEPTGNMFLQLGIGAYFRHCLARRGINLSDQGVNQVLAEYGLKFDLSTLDLRNASNTICRELVWLLLPEPWAALLDDLRSPLSLMPDGTWVRLEMFSSMGNGFTFELETLIFWALSLAACEIVGCSSALVSVYGDDVIVPNAAAPTLEGLFSFCGFELNGKKSYSDGLFRESCGEHFFNNISVTPLYYKEPVPPPLAPTKMHYGPPNKRKPRCATPRELMLYALHNRTLRHAVNRGFLIESEGEALAYVDQRLVGTLKVLREAAQREAERRPAGSLVKTPYPAKDGDVYEGLWVCSSEKGIKLRRTAYQRNWYYLGIREESPVQRLDGNAVLAVVLRSSVLGRSNHHLQIEIGILEMKGGSDIVRDELQLGRLRRPRLSRRKVLTKQVTFVTL